MAERLPLSLWGKIFEKQGDVKGIAHVSIKYCNVDTTGLKIGDCDYS